MDDDEQQQQTRFLVGCLVLVGLLGCGGILFWTPLPALWVYIQ